MEPWLWPDHRSPIKWLIWFILAAAVVGSKDPWVELLPLLLVYAGIVAVAMTIVVELIIFQKFPHLSPGVEPIMEHENPPSTQEIPTVSATRALPAQPDHAPKIHRKHHHVQATERRIARLRGGVTQTCYIASLALQLAATVLLIIYPEEMWWHIATIGAALPLLFVVANLGLLFGSGILQWYTTGGFRQWREAAKYQKAHTRDPHQYPEPVRSTYRWISIFELEGQYYRERPPASRFVRSITNNLIIWLAMAVAVQLIFHPDPFVSTYIQVWISLLNAYWVQNSLFYWHGTTIFVDSQRIKINLEESLFFLVRGASPEILMSTLVARTPQGKTFLEFLIFRQRRTIKILTQASNQQGVEKTARRRWIPIVEPPPFYEERGQTRIIRSVIDADRFIEAINRAGKSRTA